MKGIKIGLLFLVLGTSLAVPESGTRMVSSSTADNIKTIFKDKDANFQDIRHPTKGNQGREKMLKYIQNEVEVLQIKARQKGFQAVNHTQSFSTDIQVSYDHKNVTGTNIIVVLHGTANETDDEPVMLLANYDTAASVNTVNEGSGVVAMLTLLDQLVHDLPAKEFELKSSVIFAFTDVAHKKYGEETGTPRGRTGAAVLANDWLPLFMSTRKQFRGVIVLDNLLNYNDTARSQPSDGLGIDKSFTSTYMKLAESNFAGDFIGLVHRNDHMDNPLAQALELAWNHTLHQTKRQVNEQDSLGSAFFDAKLLRFTFSKNTLITDVVNHFFNSEQSAFWNEHASIGQAQYPAILLTDTRNLRFGCKNLCTVNEMLTDSNIQFMTRTIKTLKRFIIQNQTDSGALSSLQTSMFLLIGSAFFAFYSGRN